MFSITLKKDCAMRETDKCSDHLRRCSRALSWLVPVCTRASWISFLANPRSLNWTKALRCFRVSSSSIFFMCKTFSTLTGFNIKLCGLQNQNGRSTHLFLGEFVLFHELIDKKTKMNDLLTVLPQSLTRAHHSLRWKSHGVNLSEKSEKQYVTHRKFATQGKFAFVFNPTYLHISRSLSL